MILEKAGRSMKLLTQQRMVEVVGVGVDHLFGVRSIPMTLTRAPELPRPA